MSQQRPFNASLYILPVTIIATMVGAVFGALFDTTIDGRRTIAVLAALAAIAVDYGLRRTLGKAYPQLFGGAGTAVPSPPVLFVAVVIAIAGGLATHDLGLVFGVMSGVALGGFSGLFAGLMTAILVTLAEMERRRPGPSGR